MLQDISPHSYQNEYRPRPCRGSDRIFVFSEEGLLCRSDDRIVLPTAEELGNPDGIYLFSIDGIACRLCDLAAPAGDGFRFLPTRLLREMQPSQWRFAAAAAESLFRWYRQNRFCGKCGEAMSHSTSERAMVCPACGTTVYPKICPAVIVAVTDGDRLLLTKYAGRSFSRWALIAGFAEIGETIEQTVRREVAEETGLRVRALRYYRSQPWVYTDTLLFGFWAELDGDDTPVLRDAELSTAQWFSREDLPSDHSEISLTGEMIECFRRGGERNFL